MKDYYKILGVEKGASKDDIKKAFRKQAHQFHPDKNKNDPASSQKFKEASEAYSVLSDDQKRKQYDTYGSAGPGGGAGSGGFGGFNPQDFGGFDFSGFQQSNGGVEFDIGDIFGEFFGGGRSRQAQQPRGHDISVNIELTFEESIFGVERDISITKASKCVTCSGNGAAPGSSLETCKTCSGKGKISETKRSFIGAFSTTRVCDTCHGRGQIPKEKCPTCHGEGVTERLQEISVKIPPGIEEGQMVRLTGMGEAVANGVPGDLYIKVHIRQHPVFHKEGMNLVMDLNLKLSTALLGGDFPLKTLDGDIVLKIPEGSNSGDILRVKGKGVPSERGRRGDILIRVNVDLPKRLNKDAKKLIESLKQQGL